MLPPPLTRVTEVLDERNADLPGTVTRDVHGRLLKRYLKFDGFATPMIDAYNRWINTILPRQIASQTIDLPSGEVISFTQLILERPALSLHDGRIVLDYPALAMQAGRTYAAAAYVDLVSNRGGQARRVPVFKLPVMVGSDLDNLKGKTDAEKLRLRHDPSDPNGYFIIRDAEKLILLQEHLRMNKPLLYFDSKKKVRAVCKMTCATIRGTKVVSVFPGRKQKTIKLNLQFMGKNQSMPVFSAFRMLGVSDTNEIFARVARFVAPSAVRRVYFALQPSFLKYLAIGNDVEYIAKKRGTAGLSAEAKRLAIVGSTIEDLFPQVPNDQLDTKLNMLAIMIARLAEHLIGVRDFDDRDSWGNKRLDSAAKAMEQLFTGLWNKTLDEIRRKFQTKIRSFEDVVREIGQNTITTEFVSSFASNNWGIKEKYQKQNITDILKRDSLIATYSHLMRIITPIERKTKSPHIREVQQSGTGYICAPETPEGEGCGIVKNLAITAYLSLDHDDLVIRQALRPFLSGEPTLEATAKVMVNGVFLGWAPGQTLRDFCVAQRRSLRFPKDVAILLDQDNFLYIYSDGSRPTRPLLIVDPDGKLVIEKKNLWEAPFDELLREGCVEYIDAMEQESILIAQSIWDMQARADHQAKLVRYLEDAERALERLRTMASTQMEAAGVTEEDFHEGEAVTLQTETGIWVTLHNVGEAEEAVAQAREALAALTRRKPFTHCELDPQALMGVAASLMPMPERSQAPRVTYQAGMIKQALGTYHSNYLQRFDTSAKVLAFPSRPLFEPQLNEIVGLAEKPAGQTVIIAIMAYKGFNQEDAFIFKKEALDMGLFTIVKYKSHKSIQKQSREFVEKFERPPVKRGERPGRYAHLDENGIARVGSYIQEGDCIIGKTRRDTATQEIINASVFAGLGDEGIVDRVLVSYNAENLLVARVKVRQVRRPVEGDKFASRYAQKGTIGLILPEIDMPFSERTGMVPDVIINPHCVTADTLVTLSNGLSRRIVDLNSEGCELVTSLSDTGLGENYTLGLEARGEKPIVKLYLEDGRSLRCTPDHQIYVEREGRIVKVPAGELKEDEDKIVMGLDGIPDSPQPDEAGWELTTAVGTLNMGTKREQTLAFARLLGLMLTDGCLVKRTDYDGYTCPLSLGHGIDVNAVLMDLQLLTGKMPKPRHSSGVWVVNAPAELARAFAELNGVTPGRRTTQKTTWPEFILDPKCPKAVLREFVAGLFGGDGHAILLQGEHLSSIGFTQSAAVEFRPALEAKLEAVVTLLARLDVSARVSRLRSYGEGFLSGELLVTDTLKFLETVGYRYCIEKRLRGNAALSYLRLQANTKRQHSILFENVERILDEGNVPNSRAGRPDFKFVLEKARYQLLSAEPALNEYYSLGSMTSLHNRRKSERSTEIRHFNYQHFPTARAYLERIGALDWFNVHGNEKRHYSIPLERNDVPTFRLRLLARRDAGTERVYDIGVSTVHNFIAQGMVISNCIPSRMTIGKLIEIVASKHAAFSGERVDASAFRPFNLEAFRMGLRERGFEGYGYERLRSGITGEQLRGEIFMGPCYVQALRHHVKDKYQMRGKGAIKPASHQPVGGRMLGGAQRVGNMETDSFISHGASDVLRERLCYSSDAYKTVWCQTCGTIAISNVISKEFVCRKCGDQGNFGTTTIPYSFKLLMHMLNGVGFQITAGMRRINDVVTTAPDVAAGETATGRQREEGAGVGGSDE